MVCFQFVRVATEQGGHRLEAWQVVAPPRRCGVAYFGDGAASVGDFAVSLNFAATLKARRGVTWLPERP